MTTFAWPKPQTVRLAHDAKMCNKRMTFGAAMVLNNNYVCWPCYVEATGADTSTVVGETVERFYAR